MSIRIKDDPATLKTRFLALTTRKDVAQLLDVRFSILIHTVLRVSSTNKYRSFTIPKKTGGTRTILAPNKTLKIIQRKLADILNCVYEPKPAAHGFVQSRSIVSNAKSHVRRKFVFNVDLYDFFPSINFGRVRGMFMATPYNLPPEAATLLAQICCFDQSIPQGAPTSPIVSNMICSKMDRQLQLLAKEQKCTYTRYCDDITFSSNHRHFPKELAYVDKDECHVGQALSGIILSNGFKLNTKKTRLLTPDCRQEVTGLVTNRKANVKRRLVRQIRAMLHAWAKYGPTAAASEFSRYDNKYRHKSTVIFENVIKGKIDFVGMVRGKNDPVYLRLLKRYAELNPKFKLSVKSGAFGIDITAISKALWVLTNGFQGTGFMLENVGLVTCAHVLTNETQAFRPDKPHTRYQVRVKFSDPHIDLAVCEVDGPSDGAIPIGNSQSLKLLDDVRAVGFPGYRINDQPWICPATVTNFRNVSTVQQFLLSCPIASGTSGGPVLNLKGEVVGVIVTGSDDPAKSSTIAAHGAIRIEQLSRVTIGNVS